MVREVVVLVTNLCFVELASMSGVESETPVLADPESVVSEAELTCAP